jgi:hypothetical protein
VNEAKQKLSYNKKLVLMIKWKEIILYRQVRKAQHFTATYVYKKSLLRKGYAGLKMHLDHGKCIELKMKQAVYFERVKLMTTAFKLLHWYKNKLKALHQMNLKVESAYIHFARKRGFSTFVKNCRLLREEKNLNKLAINFYRAKLSERYFNLFKNYTLIKLGLKNQTYCIISYYKEKLMQRTFTGLRNFVKDKKEYRINALVFKHRGWKRKLIYLWKVITARNTINSQPDCGMFYFCSYIWQQTVFNKELDSPRVIQSSNELKEHYYSDSIEISHKVKYSKFHINANKKLTDFLKKKIIVSWKSQTRKIVKFKRQRGLKLLKEIIYCWSEYADKKFIDNCKIKKFQEKYNFNTTAKTFMHFSNYLNMKINLKRTLGHYQMYSTTRTMRK